MTPTKKAKQFPVRTFVVDPFDIDMHWTGEGLMRLHGDFTRWLRTLSGPARFVCWLMPTNLEEKITQVGQTVRQVAATDPERANRLQEYRRYYEMLQDTSQYQKSVCGIALWSQDSPRTLSDGIAANFGTPAREAVWPTLFEGNYSLREAPFWHIEPVGRPGGRLLWTVLTSYEFLPSVWEFDRPLKSLMCFDFPIAVAIDIPRTYDRNEGREAIERKIAEYQSHLLTLQHGEDSRSTQRLKDCYQTLEEINQGDLLHRIQISIAVAAPDTKLLQERVNQVIGETRAWFLMRQEFGELLSRSFGYFSPKSTAEIGIPETEHPMTSRAAAFLFSPLGYRKMASTDGVLRGESLSGSFPVFHNSWVDKKAVHEIWVGQSGQGKTFMINCYVSRTYAHYGIPFDLLEPMGHGEQVANAFGLPWYKLNASSTTLNPQDVMFEKVADQVAHTIMLYECILGYPLLGEQRRNVARGVLSAALVRLYSGYPDLTKLTPEYSPTCDDVCDTLVGMGDGERAKQIAKDLADEIAGLCCGSGTYAHFLNGETNVDLSRSGRQWIGPRVFSFHEMRTKDPVVMGLAYVQVLSAIRRDSLIDEQPRMIVVDETYRLMQHPALMPFLVEAAKTFRTRRKKLICVDQEMSVFLEGDARHIFDNTPIRVYFSQKNGIGAFKDQAFSHFNQGHLNLISQLKPFCFVLDIQNEGIWHLWNRPAEGEYRRFGSS